MANTRISMRKIKEVLRLHYACALSNKRIAKSLGISASTVHEYLTRFKESKLGWPLGESITEDELERKLFPSPQSQRTGAIPQPDWAEVHKDLKKKGVTLALLWQEYKADHPNGYQYSQFCEHYRRFAKVLSITMRQVHKAGERLFVDYCGPTVPVTDPDTGEVRQAQVFVAVLGASSYTYAEATWTQTVPDWVGAHVRRFAFLGGVPAIVVPDYVAGHIIVVMCPFRLCGQSGRAPRQAGRRLPKWPHNFQRESSQASRVSSSHQTDLRGNSTEDSDGGSHKRSASSFARILISA